VQVALSVTLLAGAGLLVRGLDALSRIDPGFDPGPVLTFRVSGSFGEERDYNRTVQRINRSLDELARLPEVEAAATTTMVPGVPNDFVADFHIVELRDEDPAPRRAGLRMVSPSYFETLQIPILEGELCRRPGDAQGISERTRRIGCARLS
jgi:putative ABC transport system permease protein